MRRGDRNRLGLLPFYRHLQRGTLPSICLKKRDAFCLSSGKSKNFEIFRWFGFLLLSDFLVF